MNIPKNLMYTKSHEWVEIDGDKVKVGLTEHASEMLGDIVFINLPDVGEDVEKEENLGDVESVKAVSEIVSPATGKVSAVNEEVIDNPGSVNGDPYGMWLLEIEDVSDERELLDAEAYEKLLEEEA